jgi:hypothetical protein
VSARGGGDFVEVAVLANEAVAASVRERFEEAGIEGEFSPAYDTLPAFGVSVGTPVRVMVLRGDAEVAGALVEAARGAGEAVDWGEVDVGEAEDAVAGRIASRGGGGREDWEGSRAVLRAKGMRRWGVVLVGVGVGCVFALMGYEVVLFVVLALSAVWLGRAHAVARQRGRVEKALAE